MTAVPEHDPERVLRRYWREVWTEGEIDAVDELVADRWVRHEQSGTRVVTPDEFKQELRRYQEAIRGATLSIDDLAVAGDRVWARITGRGVNLGSGEPVAITWLQVHRVEGGRIAESWVLYRANLDWEQ